VDEDGKPQFDWNDLLNIHASASAIVSKHKWLAEWREVSFGRQVELLALGEGIAETENEHNLFVLPLWRHAGLTGAPQLSVHARRLDESGWGAATIYFGMKEPRALINRVIHPDWKSKHWLDRLEVHFHPTGKPGDSSSRYVVVDPTGEWELRTYQANAQ
jgi:hypothetical protein